MSMFDYYSDDRSIVDPEFDGFEDDEWLGDVRRDV